MNTDPQTELVMLTYRLAKLLETLAETGTLQGERQIACTLRKGEKTKTIIAYVDGNDFHMTTREQDAAGFITSISVVQQ